MAGGGILADPQARDDDVLEALCREAVQPVDALRDAVQGAGSCEVVQLLSRDADLGGLRGGEVPAATFRDGVEEFHAGGHGCRSISYICDVNERAAQASTHARPMLDTDWTRQLRDRARSSIIGRDAVGRPFTRCAELSGGWGGGRGPWPPCGDAVFDRREVGGRDGCTCLRSRVLTGDPDRRARLRHCRTRTSRHRRRPFEVVLLITRDAPAERSILVAGRASPRFASRHVHARV